MRNVSASLLACGVLIPGDFAGVQENGATRFGGRFALERGERGRWQGDEDERKEAPELRVCLLSCGGVELRAEGGVIDNLHCR